MRYLFSNPALNKSWFSALSMKLFWFSVLWGYTKTPLLWNTPDPAHPLLLSSPLQHSCPTAWPCQAFRWFRCKQICPPSTAVSTNTKQRNSRAKLLCYQWDLPSSIIFLCHLLGKEGGNSCAVASRLIPPYPHCFTVTEMCLLQKYVILTCANHWVTSFIIDHLLSVNRSAAADAFWFALNWVVTVVLLYLGWCWTVVCQLWVSMMPW